MSLENLRSAIFSPAKIAFIAYAVLVYADKLQTSRLEFALATILFLLLQVYHDDYLRIRLHDRAHNQRADLKVAVAMVALVGGIFAFLWYHVPSSSSTTWNPRAIQASFQSLSPSNKGPIFTYDLRNTTDSDYGLVNEKEIEVLFKKGNSLRQWPGIAVLDLPIFIPAGKTVATNIHFNLEDAENPNVVEFSHSSDEGFVLFDKTHRYQVEFPKRPDVSRSSENNELIR